MAVYLEFVVPGPPVSFQQSTAKGRASLTSWRASLESVIGVRFVNPKLLIPLKAILINFHKGPMPTVDVDNMSKPIFDEMQNLVYGNDRQIRQAEVVHLEIDDPYAIAGVSMEIVNGLQAGKPFVYVRIEDLVMPYPLPAEVP